MSNELPTSATNGNGSNTSSTFTVKTGLARMLKGGVIMDVVNAEQVSPYPLLLSHHCLSPFQTETMNATNEFPPGKNCRRSRCSSSYGPRTCTCRYPSSRRRSPHVGPQNDSRDHGDGDDTRDGQSPNRSFCRMSSEFPVPIYPLHLI